MKTSALILFALLAVGCLCSGISYATVGEALSASFNNGKINNEQTATLGQLPIRMITLSANQDTLLDKLVGLTVTEKLASAIVKSVQNDLKDTFIRSTGIITIESENSIQKMLCVYRTGKYENNDFICLLGELKGQINVFRRKIADQIEIFMKRYVDNLPAKLKNLHAFTTKGFEMLRGLGSPQSQAKLNEFLSESSKNKDTAFAELRKSQDDTFVVKLFKNGITHFSSSASVESLEGVERSMLKEYYQHLIQKMKIPANTQQEFIIEMRLAAMGSSGEWKSIDFLFKNSQGTAKYINVMCAYDDKLDEADFLIADIQASFELGPDVIVTTSTSKKFFGLFSSTKVKYVYRPAELTEKSIQLIFEFFKLAALEKFNAFRRGG